MGPRKYKMNPEHLIMPKSKRLKSEWKGRMDIWTDQFEGNLNIKINNLL